MTQRLGHTRRGFLTLGKRYELLEKIGLGGMGAVWRAHDTRLNREVAVKAACIQIPEGSTLARQMERCRRGLEKEVAVLSELTHPALPELYDSTGLSFATPFIAMELIAGQGLDTLRRLPPRNAVSTLLPVANALALMHDHGFIHRDVKPANILVKRAWQTVLIDFGLVSIGEPVSDEVFGTPSYIAPEYLTGQGLDARCDVWALGVTLYEILTGGVVFYEDERQWVAPPLAVVGDFDWPLSRAVGRAIERDPEERWPTMRAFEDALRAWLRAQP